MTTINMKPDDVGLQRLRIDDDAPSSTKQVVATAPSRPVTKNRAPDEKIHPISVERRRGQDRRMGDRRTKSRKVLLDTRSHRERRAGSGNRDSDATRYTRSINVKV